MRIEIDLNCDMGESFGIYRIGADDDAMLELVTSANVACGFHAGDPSIIDRTVGLQSRAVLSSLPVTSQRPSGLIATEVTPDLCPMSARPPTRSIPSSKL